MISRYLHMYVHKQGGYDVDYDCGRSRGKVPQSISDIELYRKSAYVRYRPRMRMINITMTPTRHESLRRATFAVFQSCKSGNDSSA